MIVKFVKFKICRIVKFVKISAVYSMIFLFLLMRKFSSSEEIDVKYLTSSNDRQFIHKKAEIKLKAVSISKSK